MIEKIYTPKKKPISRKLKKLVIDAAKRHAWNIGVSHYHMDVHYMGENKEDDERAIDILADITVDRRYLHATLRIYPSAVKKWEEDGDKEMEKIIAHEMSHLATQHFFDIATARYCDSGEMRDAWETCTQTIANLSINLDEYRKK